MSILTGSDILVTGGTGSFGRTFVRHALDQLNPRRIIVFSRDELKQWEVRQLFGDDPRCGSSSATCGTGRGCCGRCTGSTTSSTPPR